MSRESCPLWREMPWWIRKCWDMLYRKERKFSWYVHVIFCCCCCRISHDREMQVGEVLCIQLFFLLTKDNFFFHKKYRQHSVPISSKPPFPYPKALVLHPVKRPKRKMAHGILKQLANFNQIAGSHFLRMMGGKWCLTLARDRVSPLEEGFDRVLDAKWPISNCVCC